MGRKKGEGVMKKTCFVNETFVNLRSVMSMFLANMCFNVEIS